MTTTLRDRIERILVCDCEAGRLFVQPHDKLCPAHYRPAIQQAIAESAGDKKAVRCIEFAEALAIGDPRALADVRGHALSAVTGTGWQFYHNGVYGPATEQELRDFTKRLGVFSDEKGVASGVMEQMWTEIDRLRLALSQRSSVTEFEKDLVNERLRDHRVPAHGWTCFHCNAQFSNFNLAQEHFGRNLEDRPACQPTDTELDEVFGQRSSVAWGEAEVERACRVLVARGKTSYSNSDELIVVEGVEYKLWQIYADKARAVLHAAFGEPK